MIGNKATVLPLRDYRGGRPTPYFTPSQLNQLLGLYSRNVARGVWRDYAIDHRDGQALFSVFRHTHESAAYTIVKTASSAAHPAEFIVLSGRQRLRVARSLGEAIDFFRATLSRVPGRAPPPASAAAGRLARSPLPVPYAGNDTSTRPSGPYSARIVTPGSVNTRPVCVPVVTKVPAGTPPRLFATKLTSSTKRPIGAPARKPVQSANGLPSAVTAT